jgi:hypothetical protein
MSLKLSQIRSAIQTQIETIDDFHLVKVLPDYFGRTRETIAHKGFVIALSVSNEQNERQRRSIGVYVSSNVAITFAYRLRPMDAYPTDYDLFLNAEESIILACLNSYASIQNEIQIRYNNSNRQSTDSNEWLLSTINFTVYHTIGA